MKRKYKKNKWVNWLWMVIGLIATIGIGGFFTTGGFLGVPILKFLPLIVHQIVGWSMIVGSIIAFVMGLRK